jgi:hypothetical protein
MSHVTTAAIVATLEDVEEAAKQWGIDPAAVLRHAQPVEMMGYAEGRLAHLIISKRALAAALGVPAWSDLGAEVKSDGTVALHVDGDMFSSVGGMARVEQDVAVARLLRAAKGRGLDVEVSYQTVNGQRVASLRRKSWRQRTGQRTRARR